MEFYIYDLILLAIFIAIVGIFLHKNKKNLKREGIVHLYRSKFGKKFIKKIGTKYKKTLKVLSYVSIAIGYLLMAAILWLIGNTVYIYLTKPAIIETIKAPPVAPVIPYFPKLFGMSDLGFPPFYFIYFIAALAVIAIVHEFSHGIFMALNKVRIKSTGIVFLGPLIAGAFVEQNEKDLQKQKKKDQMAILSAGSFSNLILAVLFFILWWSVFSVSFVPAGATFNNYPVEIVDINDIESIGGINIDDSSPEGILEVIKNSKISDEITIENGEKIELTGMTDKKGNEYFLSKEKLKQQLENIKNKESIKISVFNSLPAIKEGIKPGETIIEIDGNKIDSYSDLSEVMNEKSPGESIVLKTLPREGDGKTNTYEISLEESPSNSERGIIGITNSQEINAQDQYALFKEPFTHYELKNSFLGFIYHLFFWLFLINFFVALFNMLPVSVLDGGRFFYLTVLGITRSEKIAKKSFSLITYLILLGIVLMMVRWFFGII